ncbi:MAG: hypothetical protein OXI94_03480 [Gemmatimonadota bacterium]|nr:hypothetical protein [Gemmatimonadota bacterium]
MRQILTGFLIPALLCLFAVASAQLPPEIIADKHLLLAEQRFEKKDYAGAFKEMEKVVALQKEHSLTLPVEFHFKYARVALSADSTRIALESVTRYLSSTGREGEFYKEALALLIETEGIPIDAEETCTGKPLGSSCWMALADRPECYVWIPYLQEGETVTWSGRCSGNVAQGEGTITWGEYISGYSYNPDTEKYDIPVKIVSKGTGVLQKGKMHGQWVERIGGSVLEGPYVDGKKHGYWIETHGTILTEEGPYENGKKHGRWISRDSDGREIESTYVYGEEQ